MLRAPWRRRERRTQTTPITVRPVVELLEYRLACATVTVNAAAGLHAINPDIYGVAFADQATLQALNLTINRHGGNTTSSYNWQLDADNKGNDWYFESFPAGSGTPGGSVDQFIADTFAGGAQPVITIPMLGWVAKLGANRSPLASFSESKYGTQQSHDPWPPKGGNGVLANGQFITGNDPNDANRPADAALQQGWLQHLVEQWGGAANGGVRYYNLDNEPSIWYSTHRDVHPQGPTMEEIRDKTIAYARMIKSVDPAAQIIGPEEWGWAGYLYSGADQKYAAEHNYNGVYPDRAAHGNMDYLPWLLDQLHQEDVRSGQRLLDVFAVHYYPQGGEFSDDVSRSMQQLRNRSTRSLWDPNYVDQSWINDKVDLIPRLKQWVATYYPGTQVGLTEYNWGAEGHMNGATTEADILGILGREGLDRANMWTTPAAGTPTYLAFQMYRNYDGQGSTFGDISVGASVGNPDDVSSFAAVRSADGTLTIMVINKTLVDPNNLNAATPITVNLGNFAPGGPAQRWQLAANSPSDLTKASIKHLADVSISGGSLTFNAPRQSVALFVIPPADTTGPASLQFSSASYSATENAGNAVITVTRTGGSGSVTAQYAATSGTAVDGTDFQSIASTLTFNANETSKTFSVPLLTDSVADGNKTVTLTLSTPGTGAVLGNPQTAVLTITDVDAGPVRINFTRAGSPAPDGWINDVGLAFGDHGGLTYGWNVDNSANGIDRNSPRSPDELRDSFAFMQKASNPNAVWQVAVPNGRYQVRLAAGDPTTLAGSFNIRVEGVTAIQGQPTAQRRWLVNTVTVTVADGALTVSNGAGAAGNKINYIEVTPLAPQVRAVNAGGAAAGGFAADAGFTGGQTASTTAAINLGGVAGAAQELIYQSERYGDFSYRMDGLTPGVEYTVRLHFAEIYWNAAGKRKFNVKINGTQVLTNFDIFAAAGRKNKAVLRQFRVQADNLGAITLDFLSVVNYAKVSAIEVLEG